MWEEGLQGVEHGEARAEDGDEGEGGGNRLGCIEIVEGGFILGLSNVNASLNPFLKA